MCPPNNTGTPGFSDLPTALIDTEANEKKDSIVNSDEKNEQSLFCAKTLNSGGNNEKSFQNCTNKQEESDCLTKKEHCDDQQEYETYDFIQYETSNGLPFLETYESVTVEQLMKIIKNEFEIELTSNILKSIEDSVIDSVLKKLSNGPATIDWTF